MKFCIMILYSAICHFKAYGTIYSDKTNDCSQINNLAKFVRTIEKGTCSNTTIEDIKISKARGLKPKCPRLW